MMRADDGCIDHLQSRVTHSASSECLQDHIPQAAVGPPTELTKDRIPVAKFLRQIAPGRAGSHQPKHRVEHAAMIARWSATTPYQERLEIRPLIVGHQSANHGRSPQRAALNQFAIPASIDLSTRPRRGFAPEMPMGVLGKARACASADWGGLCCWLRHNWLRAAIAAANTSKCRPDAGEHNR